LGKRDKKREISFTRDIIDDTLALMKAWGRMKFDDREKTDNLIEILIDYIVDETEESGIVAIEIPYVGVLHESLYLFKHRREKRRQSDVDWDKFYDEKLANLRISCDYVDYYCAHDKPPYYFKYLRGLELKYKMPKSNKTYKGEFQSIQALAVIAREQNIFYEKYKAQPALLGII
jgi:hypothetical protein